MMNLDQTIKFLVGNYAILFKKRQKKEPEKRSDVDALLNHPWIVGHDKDNNNIHEWLCYLYDYNNNNNGNV